MWNSGLIEIDFKKLIPFIINDAGLHSYVSITRQSKEGNQRQQQKILFFSSFGFGFTDTCTLKYSDKCCHVRYSVATTEKIKVQHG